MREDFETQFPSLGKEKLRISEKGRIIIEANDVFEHCLDRQRVKKLLLPLKSELISHSANQRGLVITHRMCQELLERIEELGLEE